MIRIRAERREDGLEISAVGHAGFDTRGRDVVCAAVSALVFAFLHYLRSCAPSAEAGSVERAPTGEGDGSGGRYEPLDRAVLPTVDHRIEEGSVWVRTHGMNGADEAAWAVTRAGLCLIAREYPTCVAVTDAL